MMSRSRWQRIQSLFDEVVDSEPAERAARLASRCPDDAELRDSVESLLASDRGTEDPLIEAIGAAAESLLQEHQDRLLGTRVGAYRILSILGQGGMSTVYRAERADARCSCRNGWSCFCRYAPPCNMRIAISWSIETSRPPTSS